jgi:methylated-DNA-[protein]-cysteine S-methyltransferase
MHCVEIPSPVGPLSAFARDGRITSIGFGAPSASANATPELRAAAAQLAEYFAGRREEFDLPLAMPEAELQRDVCEALLTIPYGETVSYGELTQRIGRPPEDVRAVAAAIGRNPFVVVVPCHRVIGADGSLVGFGGGLPRKARLLEHEAAQLQLFTR